MSTTTDTRTDYSVPDDAEVATCDHCGAPFPNERIRALHEGLRHADALTPDQRERVEAAREEESDELRLFRYKSLAGLVLLYFLFLLVYAFATAEKIGFAAA